MGKKHSRGLNVKHAKRWETGVHIACVISGQCSHALMYSFYFQDCLVFTVLGHMPHSDQRLHRAQSGRSDSVSYPESHLMSQTLVLKKELLISTYGFAVRSLEHTNTLQILARLCSRRLDGRAAPCHQMHSRGRGYEIPLRGGFIMIGLILRLHVLGVQAHLCS